MRNAFGRFDDPRRAFLLKALAAGLFAGAVPGASGQIFGRKPARLPAGQSIYELRGRVQVNGKPASMGTRLTGGEVIEVPAGGKLVFVVGADAFILREGSRVETKGGGGIIDVLRLTTGALLAVFGKSQQVRQVQGATATIGIRGTGLYVESEPDRTYICTCYGAVDIAASNDPAVKESILSQHHDAPRYVLGPAAQRSKRIVAAPFKDHDDLELMLIETLVGRTPPFSLFDESYGSSRRY